MDPDTQSFFDLDSVVYSTLLEHLPDTAAASLSEANRSTYDRVREITQERLYWLKKLKKYGIHVVPSNIDPALLYRDLLVYDNDEPYLTNYLKGVATDEEVQELFIACCESGCTYLTRLLLADERVDPTKMGNYALKQAIDLQHTDVIKLLLDDKRVKELYDGMRALEAMRQSFLDKNMKQRLPVGDFKLW